ncbi:endolytic transglycosylase MltG [Legionella feeleii]|uniref:Endolytic murein transglycosylase n=1 Tax=Legionella feeleii TaxID=453 RepID=A0A0W0U4D0_9GAMM|nr:endolytic transglycosylase MltG [Legionella feeleii]KTD02693.1 periplasmic solute-binding protein [Legionella feeleii]SPX59748.1 putative periplasmic solute-binding protein [Legionella feeleii]STX38364.1 putative periplasmic solute-binding protein [Legionella feeleii]
MKKRWFKSTLFGCLAIFIVVSTVIGYDIYKLLAKPMVISADAPITITIDKNSSASGFVRALKSKQLIQSDRLFLLLIRFQGLSHHIKAGIYQIKPGESAQQLLKRAVAGDVLVESFTIIEGTTLSQVKTNLSNAQHLKYNVNDWQLITNSHPNPEGLLLADTYNYNAGSDAKHLLQLANQNLVQYLNTSWQNRAPGLPYKSPYELLIAASILEKEAALAKEKRIISGVIVNRLKKFMPLQMDPTVIYALGDNYNGKLGHHDLDIDSPYNTYRYRGLPPTPIAMVGKEAIDAAAHPQPTNYLYFVAKGDGSHYFSATYEEQKEAIARYQSKGRS